MAVQASFGTTGDLNLVAGISLEADNNWTNTNYFQRPVKIAVPDNPACLVSVDFLERRIQDPTGAGMYNACMTKATTQTLTGANTFDESPTCRNPVNTTDALNFGTMNDQLAVFAGVKVDQINSFTGVNTFSAPATATSLTATKAKVGEVAQTEMAVGSISAASTTIVAQMSTNSAVFQGVVQPGNVAQMLLGYASPPNPGTAYNPNGRFVYLERNNTSSAWPIMLNPAVNRPYYQTWLVTGTATVQGSIIFPSVQGPIGQVVQIWNGLLAGRTLLITGETNMKFYTKPSNNNTWTSQTTVALASGYCITLVYRGEDKWYSMFAD